MTGQINGCATPTGKTVTLDIGNGREADVMIVADAEGYADDQKDDKDTVAEAQKQYQADLKTWNDAAKQSATLKKQVDPLLAQQASLAASLPTSAAALLPTLHL